MWLHRAESHRQLPSRVGLETCREATPHRVEFKRQERHSALPWELEEGGSHQQRGSGKAAWRRRHWLPLSDGEDLSGNSSCLNLAKILGCTSPSSQALSVGRACRLGINWPKSMCPVVPATVTCLCNPQMLLFLPQKVPGPGSVGLRTPGPCPFLRDPLLSFPLSVSSPSLCL